MYIPYRWLAVVHHVFHFNMYTRFTYARIIHFTSGLSLARIAVHLGTTARHLTLFLTSRFVLESSSAASKLENRRVRSVRELREVENVD